MKDLTTYRASDRRIYNGAPCSDMQREWDHTRKLVERMQKAEPTARCVYFPMEAKYLVFVNSRMLRELTGNFHEDKQLALIEAIQILEKSNDR